MKNTTGIKNIFLCFLLSWPLFAAIPETHQILILNSYNAEYRWTMDQYEGIMEQLEKNPQDYVVYTEYLDWKRFPDEEHIGRVYELCKDKYPGKNIDLIVATDDRALQFAVENRTELFSDAPIVFSGIYRDAAEQLLQGQSRVTGVYEDLDLLNTLRYALRIQNDIDQVYLINEMTESGQGTERLMVEAVRSVMPEAAIVSLSDSSIEEIERIVHFLPQTSMILIGSYFIEKGGRNFATEVLAQRISRASTVPVYTVFMHVFGSGVLGGSMLSGSMMGKNAGEIALQILSGKPIEEIPAIGGSSFITVFDYTVVKKFGIPLADLPPGALFINRKPPFLETYRFESAAILVLFILMGGFLSILAVLYKRVKHIAFYDQLTGLSNRANVFKSGDKLLALNQIFNTAGLLCIDVDNFKYLTDTFGHGFGDKVLVRIATLLGNETGKDVRVAHFGADVFLVLVLNSTKEKIISYAERLLGILGSKMTIDGREIFLTYTVSVALYPEHAQQFSELIQNADTALHRTIYTGKTQITLYDNEMFRSLQRRMDIEHGLRCAIENGELFLVYQGQINLVTGKLDGLEALLRWNHPVKGLISPVEFIPVAEGTGQIEKIGLFVFTEAVRFIKRSALAGHSGFSVSINVSVRQMHNRNFVEQLVGIIREEGVDAGRITLEITESVLMEAVEEIHHMLDRLREAGFRLALDDFGTGYSSLTYLRNFPVNYIKMDKSFIDDMFDDGRNKLLTGTIIEMCHNLGIQIIAEGVEFKEQYEFLQERKCDLIQGFYFSKPAKEIDTIELFEHLFL